MSKLATDSDGSVICTLHDTGHNEVTGVLTQPNSSAILEHNQKMRNNEHLQRDLTFGRQLCSMPKLDFLHWSQKYPKLADYSDPQGRRAAWIKFIASSEGAPYRVREKRRGKV